MPLPDDSNVGFLYPFGFDVAADGSLWVPQLNSGNLIHVDAAGNLLASYFVSSSSPQDVAVRPDGQVFISQFFSPDILQLDPGSGTITPFAFDPNFNAGMLNFTPSGDLWLGDFFAPTRYDASGNITQTFSNYGTIDPQVDPSSSLWVSNFAVGQIQRFAPDGSFQFSSPTPGGQPLGVAVFGVDSTASLPTPDLTDYYSFTLDAGRSATINLKVLAGSSATLELQDAAGHTLALGVGAASGQEIDEFIAPATGTYYVKVSGNGAQYSLIVTRNADFDTGGNTTLATAADTIGTQTNGTQTSGRRVVLGAISAGGENFDSGSLSGYQVAASPFGDDTNMSVVASAAHDGPYGLQILDGNGWLYRNDDSTHLQRGDSFSYWIRPSSIADGRAYVGFGATATGTLSIVASPNTGEFMIQRNPGYDFETLATVPQSWQADQWYQVKADWGADGSITARLYASDGTTLLSTVTATDDTIESGGIAFRGFGSVWNVDTYAFGSSSDFYKLTLGANQQLDVTVKVPAFNSGEFVNNLDPALRVYDPSGHVIATADPTTLEANLRYKIPAGKGGTYTIEVLPSARTPKPTQGEYILVIAAVDTPLPTFAVDSTVPPNGAALYTPPSSITVNFNDQFQPATVQAGDLKVDGVPGSSVSLVDGDTATFGTPYVYSFGGHYYMLTTSAKNWADAEAEAVAKGGHLVTVNNAAEQTFLKNAFASEGQRNNIYWIGLNDIASEGNFVWSSGQPVTYTDWGPGEPNDAGSGEDAAVINWYQDLNDPVFNGAWNDFDTSQQVFGIIELNSKPAGTWAATEGTHTVQMAAGSVKDLQGTNLTAYVGSFTLDYTAPRVVGSSIQEGAIVPTGGLTYTVTFSEPLQTSLVDASDIGLVGTYSNTFQNPTSVSFNAAGTVMTATFANVGDDAYRLVLFANPSSFVDKVGLVLDGEPLSWPIPPNQSGNGVEGGDFSVDFATDPDPQALPVPLVPIDPPGSLVYRTPSDAAATLAFTGDTDRFTINLDAGQTATVLVDGVTAGLTVRFDLTGPGGLIGSAVAAAPGGTALLQTAPVNAAGTYTITVGSAGGLGQYSVRLILNAAVEQEPNNSIADAQSLAGSFLNLGNGMSRGDVLGTSDGAGGYTGSAVSFDFIDISGTGTPTLQGTDDSVEFLDLSAFGFSCSFYGQDYSSLYYSTNGLITFRSPNGAFSNTDLTDFPNEAAIAPFWNDLETFSNSGAVYWEVLGSGSNQQLVLQWNQVSFFSFNPPVITFEAILGEDGSIRFNYQNLQAGVFQDNGASATVGIKNAGLQGPDRLLLSFDSGPNEFVGTGQSTVIQAVPPTSDYYSVDLTAGQTLTVALADLVSQGVHVELLDGGGNVVAQGLQSNELVTNGGFETGTFDGWTTQTTDTPFIGWTVSGAGAGAGFDMAPTSPRDGSFDAWNGFDGDGPMQYIMYQDVTIPAGSTPTLSWQDRIQWNFVLTGTATQARIYDVEIVDPATDAVLASLYSFSTGTDLILGDTGWQGHTADLSAYAGQTIRLRFFEDIPESFTGPAQIEFDAISINLGGPPAPTNVDDLIANFVAPADGTYYIHVLGEVAHDYNLVATVGAAFDTEANDTQATAQPLAGNDGALGAIVNQSAAAPGTVFEGLTGSESGDFYPPDTILAVGPDSIIEGTNVYIRVTDKAGTNLLTESLDDLFGTPSAGDPNMVYDEGAGRFYIISIDGLSNNQLLLAVSNTSNPLDGFSEIQRIAITPAGDLADFPKIGFNADAVFLEVNDFVGGSSGGNPVVTTIQKSSILDANPATLVSYNSTPAPNFRAMVPAQMHGAPANSPMYFIQERSFADGGAIQVVTMTNYLSASPTFVYTNIPVQPYLFPPSAQQPGGLSATNDTTFTQLDWRGGTMVAAHTIGLASDPSASKVRWYQIDTTGSSPSLIQQGTIDPGPGVSTYFGSIAQDAAGNLGVTYMESSATEPISMYVAGKAAGTTPGTMGPGVVVAAGLGFNFYSQFRNGDFSGLVVDPANGSTFWAANEYAGSDFLWNTKIASFQVALDLDSDWYSVDVADGNSLRLTVSVPASGPGEFVNNLVPRIELYNSSGVLIDSAEGIGAVLTTGPLAGGSYSIRVLSVDASGGEYAVAVEQIPPSLAPAARARVLVASSVPAPVKVDSGPGVLAPPAAPTVSLAGTSPTAPVRVVYSQGSRPAPSAPTIPVVDVVLGVVSGRVRARQTGVTDQSIGDLAGALLDEGGAP